MGSQMLLVEPLRHKMLVSLLLLGLVSTAALAAPSADLAASDSTHHYAYGTVYGHKAAGPYGHSSHGYHHSYGHHVEEDYHHPYHAYGYGHNNHHIGHGFAGTGYHNGHGRAYGHDLVGPFYHHDGPYGPFGFYANFYHH